MKYFQARFLIIVFVTSTLLTLGGGGEASACLTAQRIHHNVQCHLNKYSKVKLRSKSWRFYNGCKVYAWVAYCFYNERGGLAHCGNTLVIPGKFAPTRSVCSGYFVWKACGMKDHACKARARTYAANRMKGVIPPSQ